MAKITAIIVTIIGILLILKELAVLSVVTDYNGWIIAIGVLVIGIAKLIRNFKK
ncbi:MAG: hypothetical protein Q8N63_05540 [Nanoarchaeota archaeon]|nr:hypothetical protein [Nanoarchaeota archaeon]